MNIDVRNIEGIVLDNIEKLLKEKKWTSTAKATRYVISKHYELRKTIINLEEENNKLKREIKKKNELLEETAELRLLLRKFINVKDD